MDAPNPAGRPRLDARLTAWLIEQRAQARAVELERARLQGELAASERIERAAQRYADRLEERLAEARRREASLARALGYAEAQRDALAARLGAGRAAALPGSVGFELVPEARAEPRARPTRRAATPGA